MKGHLTDRSRYLVAYDIRDPVRLRLVHRIVKDHGETLQYSVFLCDLAPQELTGLKWRLGQAMAHDVDSILVLDLGDPGDLSAFTFLGERSDLPPLGLRCCIASAPVAGPALGSARAQLEACFRYLTIPSGSWPRPAGHQRSRSRSKGQVSGGTVGERFLAPSKAGSIAAGRASGKRRGWRSGNYSAASGRVTGVAS